MFNSSRTSAAEAERVTAFDFDFTAIDGNPMPLSAWRGKALLVVNTASFCGFTSQYEGLQKIWTEFQDRGLIVVGVPSNDFHQESSTDGEVAKFCQGAFGVTFPLTTRERVKGSSAHPFYRWAKEKVGAYNSPWWNFHKFLIGRDGRIAGSFGARTKPDDPGLVTAIKAALAKAAASG